MIRQATQEDTYDIKYLINLLYSAYDEMSYALDDIANEIEQRITDPEHIVLVAEYEDIIVGYISGVYSIEDITSIYTNSITAYLDAMYVLKAYRGLGIATDLLSTAEQMCKRNGANIILLHSDPALVGFYTKAGYKQNYEMYKQL